jgi:hypothetical protein
MTDQPLFVSVHFPASVNLDWINHRVAHYEGNIGPLVEIKLDNDMSLFKFDALGDPPTPFATISPQAGGKPQVPDGAVLVASGRIFIEGEQVLCAATREP